MDIPALQQQVRRRNQLIASLTRHHPELLTESADFMSPIQEATVEETTLGNDLDLEMDLLKRIDSLMDKARKVGHKTVSQPKIDRRRGGQEERKVSGFNFQRGQVPQAVLETQQSQEYSLSQQNSISQQREKLKKEYPPIYIKPQVLRKQAIKKLKQLKQSLNQSPTKRQPTREPSQQEHKHRDESLDYSMSFTSMQPFVLQHQKDEFLQELMMQEAAILQELKEIDMKLAEL